MYSLEMKKRVNNRVFAGFRFFEDAYTVYDGLKVGTEKMMIEQQIIPNLLRAVCRREKTMSVVVAKARLLRDIRTARKRMRLAQKRMGIRWATDYAKYETPNHLLIEQIEHITNFLKEIEEALEKIETH